MLKSKENKNFLEKNKKINWKNSKKIMEGIKTQKETYNSIEQSEDFEENL